MSLIQPAFRIVSHGTALPGTRLGNPALAAELGVTPNWIEERCGIRNRYVATNGENATSLAITACQQALQNLETKPDFLICATYTPDRLLCPIAPGIVTALGLEKIGSYDLNAACTGGILGMLNAVAYLSTGMASSVLVVASDTTTRYIRPDDTKTRILFGDGAAALVLESVKGAGHRLLSTTTGSDGSGSDWFYAPVPTNGDGSMITMDGRSLFRFAVDRGALMVQDLCDSAGVSPQDVQSVIFHQANARIIKAIQERLSVPADRWGTTLEELGNTSSASLLITLIQDMEAGKLKPGDKVVLAGFGAGLTWAGALIEW